MGKRSRERGEGPPGPRDTAATSGATQWLPIVLAAGALVLGFVAWADARKVKDDLTKRVADIDQRLIALQTQAANAAKARPPAQQGPDPNKAYPIKVDGSPYKGNPTAPIVIAEFSDYQ